MDLEQDWFMNTKTLKLMQEHTISWYIVIRFFFKLLHIKISSGLKNPIIFTLMHLQINKKGQQEK